MGSESKEDKILGLFFDMPTKHWHFEDILKESGVSRSKAGKWLLALAREGIIKRVKPRGAMPYYLGDYERPSYQNRKKLFALEKFYETGFLDHLSSLPKAKTVIIFGSFSRWDWYKDSDIDVFIYGDDAEFDPWTYRRKLHREIETFICPDDAALQKFRPGLLRNIVEGHLVKGTLDFVKVDHAH